MFNLRSLDLNLLPVLEAIYEVGTVSGAAERLSLSQSATSHALSRLREASSDTLFVRTGKGLSPTPVAKAMYPPIKQALEALRTSLAEASGFDPTRSQRRFRLSIPHPMGPFYALALRAAATQSAPGVALSFDTISRPADLEKGLGDGIVDIAVDWLPAALGPFVNRKLFDDHIAILVRRGHPRIKSSATIEQLLEEEFVALHRRRAVEQLPPGLQQFARLEARETVQVDELLEIPAIIACTDLVGMFPSSMGAILQERLGLQVILIPLELPALPIYVVWHEARRGDAGHRWLRDLVAAEVGRAGTSNVLGPVR
jgi:LysR family transcriptional activator for leuABCD operon